MKLTSLLFEAYLIFVRILCAKRLLQHSLLIFTRVDHAVFVAYLVGIKDCLDLGAPAAVDIVIDAEDRDPVVVAVVLSRSVRIED